MAYVSELPATAKRSAVDGERPSFRWNEERFECSDVWLVPREDITSFLRVAGGTVESVGGVLNRVVPLRNADFDFAIATSISGDHNRGGWDRTRNDFDIYRVRMDYATPRYDSDFLSITTSPLNRVLRPFATTAAGLAAEPVNGTQYNVTLHKLATLNVATYAAYGGYINDATWRGFPAGCVKFVGPTSQQTTTLAGTTTYDVTLTFEVSRIRWDYDYDASNTLVTQGYPPTASFSSVFGF